LVHILSAIVAVGTNATYFLWLARAKRDTEHGEHHPYVLQGIKTLDTKPANPAYVVLPITGVLMVLDGDIGYTTFWVALAIGLYIVMAAFAGILFAPALRRQIAVAGAEGVGSTTYVAAARRTTIAGAITMVPIAGISISWS
jgi:uncharacterized membrane protein